MSLQTVLAQHDAASAILAFLAPMWLELASTCKAFKTLAAQTGRLSLYCIKTKEYLEDADFRALVGERVNDVSKQLDLDFVAKQDNPVWDPEHEPLLAGVNELTMTVTWYMAAEIPWNSFRNIRMLQIYDYDATCDTRVLQTLDMLENLFVAVWRVDLRDVGKLRYLRRLEVTADMELMNESSLAEMEQLEILVLRVNTMSLSFMPRIESLRELEIEGHDLCDFVFLEKYEELRKFSVIARASGRRRWRDDKRLPHFCDLNVLRNCTNLESLEFRNCGVSDFAPLTNFPALKQIRCQEPERFLIEYFPLAKLQSIEAILLGGCHFDNLCILKNLPKLKSLSVPNTRVTDISSLPKFPALETVDLTGCKIGCHGPLFKLKRSLEVRASIFKEPVKILEPSKAQCLKLG